MAPIRTETTGPSSDLQVDHVTDLGSAQAAVISPIAASPRVRTSSADPTGTTGVAGSIASRQHRIAETRPAPPGSPRHLS